MLYPNLDWLTDWTFNVWLHKLISRVSSVSAARRRRVMVMAGRINGNYYFFKLNSGGMVSVLQGQ